MAPRQSRTSLPRAGRVMSRVSTAHHLDFEEKSTNYGWVLVMPATMFALVAALTWLGIALR